jgi:hypothetical protein
MMRRILLSVGSLVLLFFALLALAGVFDALTPLGDAERTAPVSRDSTIAALAQSSSSVDRQLCVVVDGQQLRARFELVMPAHEGLVKELWRSGGPGGSELVAAFLGRLSVAQFTEWPSHKWTFDELGFGSPRLDFVEGDKARILTESDAYHFGTREVSFSVAPPSEKVAGGVREITVDTRDVEIESGKANAKLTETMTYRSAPKNTTSETGCWRALGTGLTRHVYLLNAAHKGDKSKAPLGASFMLNRDRVVSLRTADIAGDTVPAIDSLLQVGVNAFPYGLAAWYLWRTRLRRSELRNCVLCVFWLVAATGTLWTARYLLFDGDVFRWAARSVPKWVTTSTSGANSPSVLVIDTMLLVGSLAWPLIAATLNLPVSAAPAGSWRRRARTMIPCLATTVAAVAAAYVLNIWSNASWASALTFIAVALLGAVVAMSLTVFVKCAGAPALSPWGVALLGVVAVWVIAISPFAFTTLDRGWSFLPRLTYLFALLCLVAGGLILLIRNQTPWLSRRRRRRFVAVIVTVYLGAVGVLILPHALDLLLHAERFEAGPWSVLPLVGDLQSLLYVIVLFSLFVALRRVGTARAAIRSAPLHRVLGVIFVVLNFYWFDDRWLYLPVPVLLGWLLAATWLFPLRKVDLVRRLRRGRAAISASPEKEGEQLLELSRAERRHYALIAAGTKTDLDQAAKRLSDARQAASHPAATLRHRFFGVPDTASPWVFGRLGAGLGAVLGVPWMALYLVFLIRDGFAYGPTAAESYPALWMFSNLFGVLTQWTLLGFALGYFFPYLRGSNAVAKAISLFVTSTFPPVVFVLLWGRQDMIGPTLWWTLQSLAFAVVLGMLMDYRLARAAGIERSAYVEIRGLSTLIGWGGAVVGATITATFALAQSTAMLYVQNALHITSGSTAGPGG